MMTRKNARSLPRRRRTSSEVQSPEIETFTSLFKTGVDTVESYWLNRRNGSFGRWDSEEGTFKRNDQTRTFRFRVNPVEYANDEDPFEVIIGERAGEWYLKADCSDEQPTGYPLRLFRSSGEALFVCSDEGDHI
jgi:hypothetical protein